MAALYLHNAIFPAEPESSSLHTRHISTVSSGTLRTSTTEHSHPTEPLLQSATFAGAAHLDILDRQPTHPNGQQPGWDMRLSLEDGEAEILRERVSSWGTNLGRRLRRLQILKHALEIVLSAWGIYNTVRYFIAYVEYVSGNGEIVSIVMGTCTAVSVAFIGVFSLLSGFRHYLLLNQFPPRILTFVQAAFLYLSSLLLLLPVFVNFALVFAWRNSSDPALQFSGRCHVDIDVVWSVLHGECNHHPPWVLWLVLSVIRIVVTLVFIVIYHITLITYIHTSRAPKSGSTFPRRRRRSQRFSVDSAYQYSPSMLNANVVANQSTPPMTSRPSVSHRQESSQSTLASNPHSKLTELRSFPSSSPLDPPSSSGGTNNKPESPPYGEFAVESLDRHARSELSQSLGLDNQASSISENDREIYNFVDRFRSLVSQITRETEEALEFALPRESSDYSPSPSPSPPPSTYADPYRARVPQLGYDEFGRPYPPDVPVRVVGGYIRRMPTIESMGSREAISMAASSRHTRIGSWKSAHTTSRPPTRATTFVTDYTGSEPPSRSNSLSLASVLHVTEEGELHPDQGALAQGSSISSWGTGTGGSLTSRSTASYHTAANTESPLHSPSME